MPDFAIKVALKSDDVSDADFAALQSHRLSEEDIRDIEAIAAFFALSKRMAT